MASACLISNGKMAKLFVLEHKVDWTYEHTFSADIFQCLVWPKTDDVHAGHCSKQSKAIMDAFCQVQGELYVISWVLSMLWWA